jgi:Cu(I)/Ag(I) efflux system protein CusF
MNAIRTWLLAATLSMLPFGAFAQSAIAAGKTGDILVAQAATGEMADGEVRKVDKENKKLTLKHGEIKSLDMPPMTMVFQVKDPAMLDNLQAGDKVKFKAENIGGAMTVTAIGPAK